MKILNLVVVATIAAAGAHCGNAYALTPKRASLANAQEECKEYMQQRIVSLYSQEAVKYYESRCDEANRETPRHKEPERRKPSYKQTKGEKFCRAYADWSDWLVRNELPRLMNIDADDVVYREKCLKKPLFTSEQPRGVSSLF